MEPTTIPCVADPHLQAIEVGWCDLVVQTCKVAEIMVVLYLNASTSTQARHLSRLIAIHARQLDARVALQPPYLNVLIAMQTANLDALKAVQESR